MNFLLISAVLVLAFIGMKIAKELGITSLMVFFIIGAGFRYFGLELDNYPLVLDICTFALIVITFYIGFVTDWDLQKSSSKESIALAIIGPVVMTTGMGIFGHKILGYGLLESLLLGGLLSSTDLAGLLAMLSSEKQGFKYDTMSLLSLESGINDTLSKSIAFGVVAVLSGASGSLGISLLKLIGLGGLVGYIGSYISVKILKKLNINELTTLSVLIMACIFVVYTGADLLGGNGFVAVFILGLFIGNINFGKKAMVSNFFDSLSELLLILFYFLVSIYIDVPVVVSKLPLAIGIVALITLVLRPIAVIPTMKFFGRDTDQTILTGFVGWKGSTAIILAMKSVGLDLSYDIVQLTFAISIVSFFVQNFGIPVVARMANMFDPTQPVYRSLGDLMNEIDLGFFELNLNGDNKWVGQMIKDIDFPEDLLISTIERGKRQITPSGSTVLESGDLLIVGGPIYENRNNMTIEQVITKGHDWAGRALKDLDIEEDTIVIGLIRDEKVIIPKGSTVFDIDDRVILNRK